MTKHPTRQLELPIRAVDLSFVQMLTQQLKAGLISDIGVSAFAVLTIIRAHCRNADGRSYITGTAIAKATGLTRPTVKKAIDTLLERSLVQVFEDGPKKRYFVLDHLPYVNVVDDDLTAAFERMDAGGNDGKVVVRYVPALQSRDRSQIAAWAQSNVKPDSANVQLVQGQVVAQQMVGEASIDVARVKTLIVENVEVLGGVFGQRAKAMIALGQQREDHAQQAASVPPSTGKGGK